MMAVRHGHPALAVLEKQDPDYAARSRAAAERALSFFDKRLADSEWLACDRITMADGVLMCGIEFSRMVKFEVPAELTNVTRWLAAIRARESAKAGV